MEIIAQNTMSEEIVRAKQKDEAMQIIVDKMAIGEPTLYTRDEDGTFYVEGRMVVHRD